jgi:hypothetical protein
MRVDWPTILDQCSEGGKRWTKVQLEQHVTELEMAEWWRVGGSHDDVVWILKGLEHDPHFTIANSKHVTMLVRCLYDVPKCQLLEEYLDAYPQLKDAMISKEAVEKPKDETEEVPKPEKPKPPSAFSPPPKPEPLSAEAAGRERTREVQRMYKVAYHAATNREYKPVAIKADAKWAKWLHEHYNLSEIAEFLKRAFSGQFKTMFPSTLTRFATLTTGLIKENMKPEGQWKFQEPLSDKQMVNHLWAFVRAGNRTLDRPVFNEWVKHYDIVWTAERLWAYFVKHWSWCLKEYEKIEPNRTKGENDAERNESHDG